MFVYRTTYLSLILTLLYWLNIAAAFEYQHSRWRLTDLPILCQLNVHTIPNALSAREVEQAVIHSLDTWNHAAGIQIFQYAGRVNWDRVLADDGHNTISFVPTDWYKTTTGASATALITGVTALWRIGDPIGGPPRYVFRRGGFLRAFDIALNAETFQWAVKAIPNRLDVQSVVTHELGHVLALGHTKDKNPQALNFPTMGRGVLDNDTKLRTLEPDDIAGVRFIYHRVSGALQENTNWENAVWIDGQVIVPRGKHLTINNSYPQTTIHFSPGATLIVKGGLTVESAFEPVLFATVNGEGGLQILQNDQTCQITNSIFEATPTPLALSRANDVLHINRESYQQPARVHIANGKEVFIDDCLFDQTTLILTSTSDSVIKNCEFLGRFSNHQIGGLEAVLNPNNVGMKIQYSHNVQVIESTFNQNDVGIRLIDTQATIQFAKITENIIGVEIHSNRAVRLRKNDITDNGIGVQIARGTADLGQAPDDFGYNNLFGNTIWNLALNAVPPTPVLVTGNHWGGLTLAEIDRTIRDNEEDTNLPSVQFESPLNQMARPRLTVEIIDVDATYRGLMPSAKLMDTWDQYQSVKQEEVDGRLVIAHSVSSKNKSDAGTITLVSSQTSTADVQPSVGNQLIPCLRPAVIVSLRATNDGKRIVKPFRVVLYISTDDKPDVKTDFRLEGIGWFILSWEAWDTVSTLQALQPTENLDFWMYVWLPDLPIDETSRAFYVWPHVIMSETEETFNLPGRWFTIYEDSADLVGSIKEIPTTALPGETINVRYTIQNHGRGQAEGSQTVQFYLSKRWGNDQPPQPNYSLLPPIQLSSTEGEWTSQLTLPTDVPLGDYYLWMQVNANNDVMDCNVYNDSATYITHQIKIASEAEKPKAVQSNDKRPMIWGKLKTALFQNYPNPFNPETWIPYQLSQETPVQIKIYNAHGVLVKQMDMGVQPAGQYIDRQHAVYWDGRNEQGKLVGSGVYWYQLHTMDTHLTKQLVILK